MADVTEISNNQKLSQVPPSICQCRILVIGGGIGGLAAAIALGRIGHVVTVLEAQNEFRKLGAGLQMGPNATRILGGWNLLNALRSSSLEPSNAVFKSYKNGITLSDVPLVPEMENQWHAPHILTHRADILEILIQEAERIGVTVHLSSPVASLEFATAAVTTICGSRFSADVILGADGEHSFCRSELLGHSDQPAPTGKLVYRIAVKIEDLKQHPDLIHLISPPKITCWLGPGAQVVCYELTRNDVYNITAVWAKSTQAENQFGPRPVPIRDVKAMFEQWDPTLRKLLDLAERAMYWTLFEPPENRTWTHPGGRFILIGDAAHAMMPYLAQGAAQCIEDAAMLGQLFSHLENKAQIPDLLALFQDLRVQRVFPIRDRATRVGKINELADGHEQEDRDRCMMEHRPFDVEGYPNTYGDPAILSLLYGYNVAAEADLAWHRYARSTGSDGSETK